MLCIHEKTSSCISLNGQGLNHKTNTSLCHMRIHDFYCEFCRKDDRKVIMRGGIHDIIKFHHLLSNSTLKELNSWSAKGISLWANTASFVSLLNSFISVMKDYKEQQYKYRTRRPLLPVSALTDKRTLACYHTSVWTKERNIEFSLMPISKN